MALGQEEKSLPADPVLVTFANDRLNYVHQVLKNRKLLDAHGNVDRLTFRVNDVDYELIYIEKTELTKKDKPKRVRNLFIRRSHTFIDALGDPQEGVIDTTQVDMSYDPGPPKTNATVLYTRDNPDDPSKFTPKKKQEFDRITNFIFLFEKDLGEATKQGIIKLWD